MSAEDKQRLLRRVGEGNDEGVTFDESATICSQPKARRRCSNPLIVGLFSSVFAASIIINIFTVIQLRHRASTTECNAHHHQLSYSGLEYNVPTEYTYHTKYWNESGKLSDENWDAISIDPAMIAVTPEWAASKGLPPSGEFPWDPSKQMYFVKVFHQLHCLKTIRLAFRAYEAGERSPIPGEHVAHCLDGLRQDLTCHADDTPMASLGHGHHFGEQVNQCMDFDKLVAWTQHPDRNACHHHVHEFTPLEYSIERFAFCPTDSPYYSTMTEYFQRHGHKGLA